MTKLEKKGEEKRWSNDYVHRALYKPTYIHTDMFNDGSSYSSENIWQKYINLWVFILQIFSLYQFALFFKDRDIAVGWISPVV